jgi:hypothetical protein
MTILEAVELLKQDKFQEKELLEYFQIKSLDGLEPALELKFDKENYNEKFISASFKFIAETRFLDIYNPLEEQYRFYSMVLPGLYGIYSEELQLLAVVLGLFQTVMILDGMLKDKPAVKYFKQLYVEYVKTEMSLEKIVNKAFKELDVKLTGFLTDNTVDKLKGLVNNIVKEANKIKPE